ncbi:MAG TPA: histidine phosphatase family protein [Candidatus Babeliales bacterium]|nr:histidine phosphatase family protein [Candidatus Babeliales bacterium]
MVEIYLCRHGQSAANAEGTLAGHLDSPLNDIGREQAKELAELAKKSGLKFDIVYTSPLSRAKETAEIIARVTKSPLPKTMNQLIERDFGILTGKKYSEIDDYATEFLKTDEIYYFTEVKDSETFPMAFKRAQGVLDLIRGRHKSGKVLLVAHGDIGMMLFAAFHKTPWKKALTHFHFGNSELLLLKEDLRHKPHVFEIDQRGISETAN